MCFPNIVFIHVHCMLLFQKIPITPVEYTCIFVYIVHLSPSFLWKFQFSSYFPLKLWLSVIPLPSEFATTFYGRREIWIGYF